MKKLLLSSMLVAIGCLTSMATNVWDFSVFTDADTMVTANFSYAYNDAGWTSVRNSADITDEAINSRLEALKFTAPSGKLIWQIYGKVEGNGNQLVSNGSNISVKIPALKGDTIRLFASANGDITIYCCDTSFSISNGAEYADYAFVATSDTPSIALTKKLALRKISVADNTPEQPDPKPSTQVDPKLAFTFNTLELTTGTTQPLAWTSNNKAMPTFTSSDDAVATVDNKGNITAITAGSATITAIQAADTAFLADTATIKVKIVLPDSELLDSLWYDSGILALYDSTFKFPSWMDITSRVSYCDLNARMTRKNEEFYKMWGTDDRSRSLWGIKIGFQKDSVLGDLVPSDSIVMHLPSCDSIYIQGGILGKGLMVRLSDCDTMWCSGASSGYPDIIQLRPYRTKPVDVIIYATMADWLSTTLGGSTSYGIVYNDYEYEEGERYGHYGQNAINRIKIWIMDKPDALQTPELAFECVSSNGNLTVTVSEPTVLSIYNILGVKVREASLNAGENCINGLPAGQIYIVSTSDRTLKVRL